MRNIDHQLATAPVSQVDGGLAYGRSDRAVADRKRATIPGADRETPEDVRSDPGSFSSLVERSVFSPNPDTAQEEPPAPLLDSGASRREVRDLSLRRATSRARCRTCGSVESSSVVLTKPNTDSQYPAMGVRAYGLVRCGSTWLCPVCSASIRAVRAREIERSLYAARQMGWGAVVGLLTLPHDNEPLATVWTRLSDAWSYINDGKGPSGWWSRFREKHGIEGYLWTDEVTWNPATGWHPHRHVLFFTGRPCSSREAADIAAHLSTRMDAWARTHADGISMPEANGFAPVDFRRSGALATYLAGATRRKTGARIRKMPFGLSAAHDSFGDETGEGFHPFDILAAISEGHSHAGELWTEFEEASSGRRSFRWSNGLLSQLGNSAARDKPAARSSRRDVDRAEQAVVEREAWEQLIAGHPGRETRIRQAMREAGLAGVEAQLETWRTGFQTPRIG